MDDNFFNRVLDNIVYGENSGDTAISPRGAIGRYQLMPQIARAFNVQDPTDPVQARAGALQLTQEIANRAKKQNPTISPDQLERVIYAGYNGGIAAEQAVLQGRQPPSAETQKYLQRIAQRQVNPAIPAQQVEFSPDIAAKYAQQIEWARSQGFSDQEIMNNIRADERQKNEQDAKVAGLTVSRQKVFKEIGPRLKLEIAKTGDFSAAVDKIRALDKYGDLKLAADIDYFRNQGISDDRILTEFMPQLEASISAANKRRKQNFAQNLVDGVVDGIDSMTLGLGQSANRVVDAISGTDTNRGFQILAEQRNQDPNRIALGSTIGGTIGQVVPDLAVGIATSPFGGALAPIARLGVQGAIGAATNVLTTPSTGSTDTAIQAATGAVAPVIAEKVIGPVIGAVSPKVKSVVDNIKSGADFVASSVDNKVVKPMISPIAQSIKQAFKSTDELGAIAEHERSQVISQIAKDRFGLDEKLVAPSGVLNLDRTPEILDSIKKTTKQKYDDILMDQTVDPQIMSKIAPKIEKTLDDTGLDRSTVQEVRDILHDTVERQKLDVGIGPDGNPVAVPKTKVISITRANDPERQLLSIERQIADAQRQISGDTPDLISLQRRIEQLQRTRDIITGADRSLIDETGKSVPKDKGIVSPSTADVSKLLAAKNRQLANLPTDGLTTAQTAYRKSLLQEIEDLQTVVKYKENAKLSDIDRMIKDSNDDFLRQVDFHYSNGQSRLRELQLRKEELSKKLFKKEQAGIAPITETAYQVKPKIEMRALNDLINNVDDELFKMSQGQNIDNIKKQAYERLSADLKSVFEGSMSDSQRAAFRQADALYGDYKVFESVLAKTKNDPMKLGDAKLWESVGYSAQYRKRTLKGNAPMQEVQSALSKQRNRVDLVRQQAGLTQEQSALRDAALIGGLGGGPLGFISARGMRVMDRAPVNRAVADNQEVYQMLGEYLLNNNKNPVVWNTKYAERAKNAIANKLPYGERRLTQLGPIKVNRRSSSPISIALNNMQAPIRYIGEAYPDRNQAIKNELTDQALQQMIDYLKSK